MMWLILLSATCCISTNCPYSVVTQKVCLKSIVIGDEIWIHCFEPAMKRVSKEWCHFSSSRPGEKTACRLLQEMWCRHCSWISTSYLLGTTCWREPQSPVSHIVTSLGTVYDRLSEYHDMHSNDVLLQYGIDRTPTACVTAKMMKSIHCEGVLQFLTCLTLLLMTTMILGWSRRLLA